MEKLMYSLYKIPKKLCNTLTLHEKVIGMNIRSEFTCPLEF
ncbi:hypothetical protein PMF13cell1_03773 [Blautia producta]|uniref:Uncharacterized protein n=1 Tax=Blautia producta TaxID=33035 RepID=A0A4P6M4A0_9FIRM|nr:hypothetical protein PMF13cell1_03773 [Blautia producta]